MTDNVIKFSDHSRGRAQERALAFSAPAASDGPVKRNRRSPYRMLWYKTEMAFVELNKIDHEFTPDEQEKIRKGVEAAQTLATEMARAAEQIIRPRTKSETTAQNREFKEKIRRRIRGIAARRDLSDEDIKGALTLKHHQIAKFIEKHGVNAGWLLEGKGRVFVNDKIELNSGMSGAELAAVVRTLPVAEQQMLEATIDRLLKERGL